MSTITIFQIDPSKLRAAREKKNLTTRQAARLIDIKERNLTNYEIGFARPQPHILAALCKIYDVENPMDLFSEVDDPEAFSTRADKQKNLPQSTNNV